MSTQTKPGLLVLATGLFPDTTTIEAAILTASQDNSVRLRQVCPDSMDPADWDQLIADIMRSKNIITL